MNKFFSLLCAATIMTITFAFTSCTVLTGSGNIVKQTRNVHPASEINVSTGLRCEITQGDTFEVVVETDENIQDYVIVKNSGDDELNVRLKSNYRYQANVVVYVTTPIINEVSANAGCTVNIPEWKTSKADGSSTSGATLNIGNLVANEVELSASSGSSLNATIDVNKLESEASSGSSINVQGKATYVETDVSSGASITCDCVYETFGAEASSGGNIKYKRHTNNVRISRSSGGNVWEF